MAEYINKAELIKECNYTVCWEDDEETFGISEAMIDLMPTIDIVHCGECEHAIKKHSTPYGMLECSNHHEVDGINKLVLVDDYCSDGERKNAE